MITFQWVSRPPSPHRTLPKTNLQTTDGESARNTANFSRTAKKKREVYSKERQKSKRECDASGSGWMRRWQQQQQQQLRFSSNCLKWSLGRSKRVSEWSTSLLVTKHYHCQPGDCRLWLLLMLLPCSQTTVLSPAPTLFLVAGREQIEFN